MNTPKQPCSDYCTELLNRTPEEQERIEHEAHETWLRTPYGRELTELDKEQARTESFFETGSLPTNVSAIERDFEAAGISFPGSC